MNHPYKLLRSITLETPVVKSFRLLLLLTAFLLSAIPGFTQFSGGSGTIADPYRIAYINDLQGITGTYNTAHFIIVNNIDASITGSWGSGNSVGFDPIVSFNGTLNGNNYTISGLVINRPNTSAVGIFKNLGANSAVRNLKIVNCNITGSNTVGALAAESSGLLDNITVSGTISGRQSVVGGLIGHLTQTGTLTNCHAININVTGATLTGSETGGLIGRLGGSVVNATASGVVNGRGSVGGLIGQINSTASVTNSQTSNITVNASAANAGCFAGYNMGVTFSNNSSSGSVTGTSQVGGLVGKTDTPVISSHSSASVSGTGDDVGGLIGWINNTVVNKCYATGSVVGNKWAGGLAGRMSSAGALITESYATTSVQGGTETGGLVGFNNGGTIEKSYSAGTVSGTTRVGGLVGANGYSGSLIQKSFSLSNVAGSGNEVGGFLGYFYSGTILNTYARGSVSGPNFVGGHTGYQADGTISNSYSTGYINSAGAGSGGFMGGKSQWNGSVNNSFWDVQTSGKNTSAAGTPKTTPQMLDINTFLAAGWDFNTIWAIQSDINDGYPYFDFFHSYFVNTWNGAIDRQWELAGNWSANYVPLPHQSVVIPNVPNQPIISSGVIIKGLTIQSGSSVTISSIGTLSLNGTLANNAGKNGLIIKSDASGTGSLLHKTYDVEGTIERYIPAAGYHLVSTPITQASNPTSLLFLWSYLFEFDVPAQKWIGLGAPTNTPLFSNRGYMIYKYSASPWQPDTTYRFSGALNNGAFSCNVSYPDLPGNHNLVPNPYPSPIDWNAASGWTKTNLSGSYWMWIHSANNYGVWNGSIGTHGVTKNIPVGQSFFVQALAPAPSLVVNNNARLHSNQAFYKNTQDENTYLRLSALANNYRDEIIVMFDNESTPGFDSDYDASKMFGFGTAPQLYSLLEDDKMLSINCMPYSNEIIEIPVAFELSVPGEVTLEASSLETLPSQASVQLFDMLTNTLTDLRLFPNYTFSHDTINNPVRFKLILNGLTSVAETEVPDMHLRFVNNTLYVSIPESIHTAAQLHIFDASGRSVYQTAVHSGNSVINIPGLGQGIYFARVVWGDHVVVKKALLK